MYSRRHPEASLAATSEDAAAVEGGYRLIRNDAVSPDAIADAAFNAACALARKSGVILAVADTTTVSYPGSSARDLGDPGGPDWTPDNAEQVHSVLGVDGVTGETIGLLAQKRWVRSSETRGTSYEKKRARPYEEKESFKWEEMAMDAAERLGPEAAARAVHVSDRESDLWDYLLAMTARGYRFVVRAMHDRPLIGTHERLYERAGRGEVLGRVKVHLPQREHRPARTAELEVRRTTVTLKPPKRAEQEQPPVKVNVILAREVREKRAKKVSAPKSRKIETKGEIEWVLLTTEPVDSLTEAITVMAYYRCRWRIEEFHRCWKSGCRVESLQMQSRANLERAMVIKACYGVRLLQLRESMGHDSVPRITGHVAPRSDRRCDRVLGDAEWKVLWAWREQGKPLPSKAPKLDWAYYALAALGGWKDTNRTGRAGWDVLWTGWDRLQERVAGYHAAAALGAG